MLFFGFINTKYIFVSIVPGLFGAILIVLLFYNSEISAPYYINPIPLIILITILPILIFIFILFCRQTYLVCLGITTKEYESIKIFDEAPKSKLIKDKKESCNNYMSEVMNLSLIDKLKNLFRFLIRKKSESLILLK